MSSAPTVQAQAPARRERVFYLDLVRALATFLIVLTHFNNPYLASGQYLLTNQPFGIYVGGLGVSLFLIISGAALTFTYQGRMDLRRFYLKRFQNLYPMFWLAWILATSYFFVVRRGFPPNLAPTRSLIWTVLGVDGYLANFQVRTAYLLGEWFLGFIVLFYLVFPLLLWLVERAPVPTAVAVVVIYSASFYVLRQHPEVPSAILLPVRLPELVFGMYFVRWHRRLRPLVLLPCAGVLVVSGALPTQIHEDLATTLVGIAAFLVLVVAGRWVAIGPVREVVSFVAKYSYPIFLVHHVVIYQFYTMMEGASFYPVQRYVMFGVVCVVTVILAVPLPGLAEAVTAYFKAAFSGRWWRVKVSSLEQGSK